MHRWWDDEDQSRAMLDLVDSSDPRHGVGVAVLGFHGIAKAALTGLTTTTLVDARTMADALEQANFSDVEDALYEALIDGLGVMGAYKYSELMVADMRDRAIDATTRLTQALVAKGLPWPRAVSRAADVAGVPLSGLGRYATIAITPGLDPLSAADHADRALMEYASRRVAIEADMIAVPLAKAERERSREDEAQRKPWDESQVERDALGQFAEQAASDAEMAARAVRMAQRRARRERRAKRAAKRERAAGQAVSTMRESGAAPDAQRESGARGEGRGVGEAVPTARESGSGPLTGSLRWGAAGTEVVPAGNAPNYEESGWVTLDVPLFLLASVDATGSMWDPVAYPAADVRSAVAGLAARTPNIANITVYEFAAAALPVHGRINPEDGVPIGGFLTEPDKLELQIDYMSLMEQMDRNEFETYEEAMLTLRGAVLDSSMRVVPVEHAKSQVVRLYKSQTALAKSQAEVLKAEAEAQGERVRRPWQESEVARDALGQFAEQAQASAADAEKAKARMAERRARRERRRAREARRESTRAVGAERGRTREAGQAAETRASGEARAESGRQAAAASERARALGAEREDGIHTMGMRDFVAAVDSNPVFTRVNASLLEDMGFTTGVYSYDQSFSEGLDIDARIRTDEQAGPKETEYLLSIYDYLRDDDVAQAATRYRKGQALTNDEKAVLARATGEATALLDVYNGLTGLLNLRGVMQASGTLGTGQAGLTYTPPDKANALSIATGLLMRSLATDVATDMQTADGPKFVGDAITLKTSVAGRLPGAIGRIVGSEVYLTKEDGIQWRRKDSIAPAPQIGSAIISSDAYELLNKVRTVCSPVGSVSHDPRVDQAVMDRESRRLNLGYPSKYTLTMAMLKESKVTLGCMSDKLKLDIAGQALADHDAQAVRLDGIDVYRVYLNR